MPEFAVRFRHDEFHVKFSKVVTDAEWCATVITSG